MNVDTYRGRGGSDGSGATLPPQDGGFARGVGVASLTGIAALGIAEGGLYVGTLPGGRGATGLSWGVVLGAVLALAAVVATRDRTWGGPACVAVATLGALVAWSTLSILWATAPDRAWLATHRTALALAALVLAVCLARALRDPARRFAIGLTLAASAVLVWAVAIRVFPEALAPLDDDARLAAPIGHVNALALLAVFAVPGALLLASGRRWRGPGVALLGLSFIVLALTGSRSGLLSLVATLVLALWLLPDRAGCLAALGAAVAGAAPAVAYGLLADPLSSTPLPDPSERSGAGLVLGVATAVGLVLAASVRDLLTPAATRVARWMGGPVKSRVLLTAAAALVLAGGVVAALVGRDASAGAGRTISLDSNNRTAWWGQAWRGFTGAPVQGHGAGSFVLTNIAERSDGTDALRARQPHQIVLELMTELGMVGLLLGVLAVGVVLWAARHAGRATGPAVCIVIAFLVQAQLDFPWTIPAVTVPAVAAGGVIVAMAAPPAPTSARVRVARIGVAAVATIALVASAVTYAVGLARASDAYRELGRGEAQASISPAESATRVNRLGISSLLIEAEAHRLTGSATAAVQAASRATERQPDNPFTWECLAAVSGGPARAAALARVVELDPRRDPGESPRCQPGW